MPPDADLTMPEKIQVQELLDDDGTRYVDDYQPIRDGSSWGSRCPQPLARMMGFPDADRVETWVNVENNILVAKVVSSDGGEEAADD